MSNSQSPQQLSFDLDKDGTPDVLINDTNGHTVYINIRWLIGSVLALITGGTAAGLYFL